MDLVSRLDGYLNQQIMHSNPIPVLPPPKTIQDKKDTTLLDMALKALLKERMYGNLQNFSTQNNGNKNHLRLRANSIVEKRNLLSSLDQASITKNLSFLRDLNNNSFFQRIKNKTNDKTKMYTEKKMSQISSSVDVFLKKTQQRKFRLISEKKVRFTDDIKKSQDEPQYTNFISSIEFLETEKTINLSNKHIEKGIKLPQISDKRKMKNMKTQNTKISKVLFRQNELKVTVRQDFWSFICGKKDQRIKRIKQSALLRNQSYHTSMQESINLSIGKKPASIQNSNYGGVIESKKQINKYNQNLVFKKDNFISFIANEKLSITSYVSNIFSFFQLQSKITDKAAKAQFEMIFLSLYNQSDRAWCFAIFNFLDINSNTKIDSSDLFKFYNTIDQSKIILQKSLDQQKITNLRQKLQDGNQLGQKKQRTKRQKTLTSQNGSSSHRSAQKRGTKLSIEYSIKQSTFDIDQNVNTQKNIMKNNLQNVIQLQKQIQSLNQKILSQISLSSKLSQNPQSSSFSKSIGGSKKIYLQQGLLGRKDVKISQLSSILQQVSSQSSTKKKKILQIDHKKLNIRLSSGYVQTFMAMNHNDEARNNRQFLQNLKDKVKQMSQNKDSSNSKNITGIQYSKFYQKKLFLPFKYLFFSCMQIIIENK